MSDYLTASAEIERLNAEIERLQAKILVADVLITDCKVATFDEAAKIAVRIQGEQSIVAAAIRAKAKEVRGE